VSVQGWIIFTALFLLVFGPILKALALDLVELLERLLDFIREPPWTKYDWRIDKPWTREETQEWLDDRR
jgi:hypothetical protein